MLIRSIRAIRSEPRRHLPGDDLIADPIASITHGITVHASPARVWPWLAQMGAGRAGWYSYDFIDNGGRPSARRIVADLQELRPGMLFPAVPGATDAFVLLQFEPNRYLVLGWVPTTAAPPITTWAVVLEELAPDTTRLIERGRVRSPYRPFGLPEGLAKPLGRVAHFVMVRKHLRGIAQRAEAAGSMNGEDLTASGPI